MQAGVNFSLRLTLPVAARLEREAMRRHISVHKLAGQLLADALEALGPDSWDGAAIPSQVEEEVAEHVARW